MPTEDAQWVGAELTRRFGVPLWSFTVSATDSNRWAIRLARLATGKSKILVFSYCYHGSVDETFGVLDANGNTVSRPGNVAPPVPIDQTNRVVEFNDLAALEVALRHGDVAAIVTTNYGALLMIDETHTISAGYGGMTLRDKLDPDIFIIGKSIGAGIPSGAYGFTQNVVDLINSHTEADLLDVGGIGGTLAGNALSLAAMRATLGEVLTEQAFEHMIQLATSYTDQVNAALDEYGVPWSISQLGARAEYRFTFPAPKTGTQAMHAGDDELDEFMHLFMCNRGILMTPFHNMALMCPTTTQEQVDLHSSLFRQALSELVQA